MHSAHARIGLVVNPLAGIGGEVGLGGSDGAGVQAEAVARGGKARAPERAVRFIHELARVDPAAKVLTVSGPLGGDYAPTAELLPGPVEPTTAADTTRAAAELVRHGVRLLVFIGGDGTARDVLRGVPEGQWCVGVPAGVKMHSGVFAVTPEDAAKQAAEVLAGRATSVRRDVADLDEEARRNGVLSTAIYGTMTVPVHERVQRGKRSPAHGSGIDAAGVAKDLAAMTAGRTLVFGPGTTVARVSEFFGVAPTLLGCDVREPDGQLHPGVSGAELEQLLEGREFDVVLSPIGGQGFVIGRGNHQLTERVLDMLPPAHLRLVAETAKLGELGGQLRVDAPTQELNRKFRGFYRVHLGAGDTGVAEVS